MALIRKRDTKPELVVRRMAHLMGYRFRLHRRDLPGTPDLVFPARRKVILVHGCFWHRHDCPLGRKAPRARPEYWIPKLARNRQRDVVTLEKFCCAWMDRAGHLGVRGEANVERRPRKAARRLSAVTSRADQSTSLVGALLGHVEAQRRLIASQGGNGFADLSSIAVLGAGAGKRSAAN